MTQQLRELLLLQRLKFLAPTLGESQTLVVLIPENTEPSSGLFRDLHTYDAIETQT